MVLTDSVYKTVLNILNKENRGYVTPAEFNTLAKQAQNEIFEGYFSCITFVSDSCRKHLKYGMVVRSCGQENFFR